MINGLNAYGNGIGPEPMYLWEYRPSPRTAEVLSKIEQRVREAYQLEMKRLAEMIGTVSPPAPKPLPLREAS